MRRIAVVAILVILLLLSQLSGQVLAGFQESRWQIMDLLAHPSKIEKGIDQKYGVSKTSWERTDLADGTPRWMAAAANALYNYELIGTLVKTATLLGGISDETEQIAELLIRSALLMQAVGMSKAEAAEGFQRLVNSADEDKDNKYYVEAQGIRAEMTVFSAMPMLILTLKKLR